MRLPNLNRKNIGIALGYSALALAFTPLTTHLPLGNIIEPFIGIGIYLITSYNSFKIPFLRVFASKRCIYCLLGLLAMSIIGIFTPIGPIMGNNIYSNIYADMRSCFIFAFTILLLKDNGWRDEDKAFFLKSLIWLIILGGFIDSYQRIMVSQIDGGRTLGIPYIFLVLQTFFYSKRINYAVFALLLSIGVFYAIYSLARINILLFSIQVLILIISVATQKSKSVLQVISKVSVLSLIAIALFKFVPKSIELYESSEGGKAQVERITNVVNSKGGSEGERAKSMYVMWEEPEYFLIPEGLGWRNHIYKISSHFNYTILSTQDSCWLYLYYHFGLIGGIFLSILLLKKLFDFIFSLKKINPENLCKCVMMGAFLICFSVQGVFLTVPQFALGGGIMLSLISKIRI